MILTHNNVKLLLTLVFALFVSACSSKENENLIALDVYKSPTCGCCGKWISHAKKNGFKTKTHNSGNMSLVKEKAGIPSNYRSCHTSISKEGYVFEGHIPAHIIHKFLNEKPVNAKGLIVPGMPVGSPGMEYNNKFNPYDVFLLNEDGTTSKYVTVKTLKEQFQ